MASTMLPKAKAKLVINDPFYATIVLSLKTVECDKLPNGKDLWMAATDGTHLFINPANFDPLPLAKAVGVLKHEAGHVAQLHNFRGKGKQGKRWNNAADYQINDQLFAEGGQLPDGVLHSKAFAGMSTEEIYAQLPPDDENNQGGGGGGGQGGQGGQPSGNPLDDDVMPAPDQSESAVAQAKATVQKAANIAKAMGKLPAGMDEFLDGLMNPKVSWQEQLRRFMTDIAQTDYSFARVNRRYAHMGLSLPGKYGVGAMRKLAVIIDTSGSVSDNELKQYFGEICGAVEECCPSSLVVVYCDAQVNHVDELDQPEKDALVPRRVGGGGTDLRKATDYLAAEHPDVAAVIGLTDGYTPWPSEVKYPMLWAITTSVEAPIGETIHVDLD